MNMKKENKSEIKQKMGFARRIAALLALYAVSAVYGNTTDMYEFHPAGLQGLEITSEDAHVLDKIDLGKSGRFVSVVGYLAGIGEKGLKKVAESFYAEALELAYKGSDDMEGALACWKDNLDGSRKMKNVKDAAGKIKLAITITDGIIKIKNAKTEDEQVTEACRLALHLFSSALGALTKPQIGDLISDLGDHGLDHPEDNGFAIIVNWIYDHSSLPQTLSEWWYDVRYGDAILQDRQDRQIDYGQKYEFIPPDELAEYDDGNQVDPFDTMPESNRGCFGGNTSDGRYQGLKPLCLIN